MSLPSMIADRSHQPRPAALDGSVHVKEYVAGGRFARSNEPSAPTVIES
jgi:hypothetical protein